MIIWPELEDNLFMMEKVYIKRTSDDGTQTLGSMSYKGKEIAKTLELPWRENKRRISCIPTGTYRVIRRKSPKYGQHFHILNVESRSYILIHNANYYFQLLGCIGVGRDHADINGDGLMDITSSRSTMTRLLNLLPKEFELVIA